MTKVGKGSLEQLLVCHSKEEDGNSGDTVALFALTDKFFHKKKDPRLRELLLI